MSSHHDWVEEVNAKHDAETPFAPENGQPLRFRIGDRVIYTNSNGVEFKTCITDFYQRNFASGLYARGARYLIDSSSPWHPVSEASLRLDEAT